MSEWKKVRLGEITSIKTGKLNSCDAVEDGCYPFFTCAENPLRINTAAYDSESVLVAGNCTPYVNYYKGKFNAYQRTYIITPTAEDLFGRWLFYWMRQEIKMMIHRQQGSVEKYFVLSDFTEEELTLPPLPTQRRIAAVLSSLDDKIENNRKICANLEAQAQAIFKSWFVDFEPFGGKMPQGWKMGKLGDVGNIVGGATPSTAKAEFYTEEGIAWLTPKDLSLQQTKFVAKGEIDITEEGYKSASVRMLPKGSVLFSSRAPIGYVAIAKNELCTNQGFKSVVPFDWVGSEFVYQLLRMMTPVIEERASGSTFKEISSSGMKELPVIVPSKNVLHEFSSITLPMGESQKSLEDETRTLAALRDALLPKLMSGEVDVEKVKISA